MNNKNITIEPVNAQSNKGIIREILITENIINDNENSYFKQLLTIFVAPVRWLIPLTWTKKESWLENNFLQQITSRKNKITNNNRIINTNNNIIHNNLMLKLDAAEQQYKEMQMKQSNLTNDNEIATMKIALNKQNQKIAQLIMLIQKLYRENDTVRKVIRNDEDYIEQLKSNVKILKQQMATTDKSTQCDDSNLPWRTSIITKTDEKIDPKINDKCPNLQQLAAEAEN